MNISRLKDIEKLCEIKSKLSLKKISEIQNEEMRIRQAINRLTKFDDQRHTSESIGLKSIGADVTWDRWKDRTLMSLNSQLAQILAKKHIQLEHAKKSYGRHIVSSRISVSAEKSVASSRAKNSLETTIFQSLIRKR